MLPTARPTRERLVRDLLATLPLAADASERESLLTAAARAVLDALDAPERRAA